MFNEGDNLVSTPGICSYKIAGKYRRDLGVFAVRPGGPWWALCLMRAPPLLPNFQGQINQVITHGTLIQTYVVVHLHLTKTQNNSTVLNLNLSYNFIVHCQLTIIELSVDICKSVHWRPMCPGSCLHHFWPKGSACFPLLHAV